MKILITLHILFFLLSSCESTKEKINAHIHSSGSCDRIEGFELIGKNKDTSFLNEIFKDPSDVQICHSMKYYGKSVLWAKVKALERITNIKLPYSYTTFSLDSSALIFYKNIFISQGRYFD